jgi:hypothetical protein
MKYIKYTNGQEKLVSYKIPIALGYKRDKKRKKNEIDIYDDEYFKKQFKSNLNSLNRTKNKIYDICKSEHWEYFVTLTFNKQKVDRYNYKEITELLTKWLDNQKHKYPGIKYIIVPELHKDGGYHFHGLMNEIQVKQATNYYTGKSLKDKKQRQIYNLTDYNIGWSTATQISDTKKASAYITKYITKELLARTKGKKRYWRTKNIQEPIEQKQYFDPIIKDELIKQAKKNANCIKTISPKQLPDQEITYLLKN